MVDPQEPSATPPAEPALSASALSELQRLRQVESEYDDVLTRVGAQRLKRYYDDPGYGDFSDRSWDAYQYQKTQSQPKVSSDWDPKVNPLVGRLEANAQFIEDLKREREVAARSESEQWTKDAIAYADRVQAEDRPLYDALAKDDWGVAIHSYARGHRLSFEDAVKKFKHNFAIGSGREIPSSLPPDAASPGVPGESGEAEPPAFASAQERRDWMSKRIARAQKRSA